MAIAIDPADRRIILDSTVVTAREIYAAWADWMLLSDNIKYLPAFRSVGGDELGGSLYISPYYFLLNGWRVRPMESSHNLTITGNLFVDGGGIPVVSTLGTFQINVNYTVPVQAQAYNPGGGSGPTAGDVADAVWAHSSAVQIEQRLTEAWGRLGLDPANPLISGQTQISFGAIVMALTGNETSSTLTRQ